MTTLIGSRWKRCEALSRGVLICPVSRVEFCVAQSCLHTFALVLNRNGEGTSPEPIGEGYSYEEVLTLSLVISFLGMNCRAIQVFGSGGLAGGSHPVPFRTRKLSLLAAMVLTVKGGESS